MDDQDLINDAIFNPTYAQIAKVFKAYYPNSFMFTDAWFIAPFYEHNKKPIQWKRMKGNKDLIVFIDTYFTPLFEQMQRNFCENLNSREDAVVIVQLINNLQNKNFKQSLCKELEFYYILA